jgi:hypothetical protein
LFRLDEIAIPSRTHTNAASVGRESRNASPQHEKVRGEGLVVALVSAQRLLAFHAHHLVVTLADVTARTSNRRPIPTLFESALSPSCRMKFWLLRMDASAMLGSVL